VHKEQGQVRVLQSAKHLGFARHLQEVLDLVHRHTHSIIFCFHWGTPWEFLLLVDWTVRAYQLLHQVTLLKMVQNNAPQLPLPWETYIEEKKHPSNGGNPYSDDFCYVVITRYLLNLPLFSPELMILRRQYAYPWLETSKRYVHQFQELGHCRPKQEMRNQVVLREVRGQDRVNLSQFLLLVYPTALLDHARAFIHNMVHPRVPFLPMAVCCVEHLLSLQKKSINNMPEGIPTFE
jgi:hypothetical protein